MWGRSRSRKMDAADRSIAGPGDQTRDQILVQELNLRPWQGPSASLPATLPRLGSQFPELYAYGEDPTPDPQCTHTGTDPHPDPDLT